MATTKRKTKPPFPVQSGMGEHGLSYCLIRNEEAQTPWSGGDDAFGVMRWQTVARVIDLRAHGLAERDVIRNARRFVAEWFESGLPPKPFGNPAVRELAHIDNEYPLTSKARFVSILTGRGYPQRIAADLIADAVRDGLIRERRGRYGISFTLSHEPCTRAVCDLMEIVAQMRPHYPFGVPHKTLRNVAGRIAGGGWVRGDALIQRALNAGVIRDEVRGRKRFFFPNFKTKGK